MPAGEVAMAVTRPAAKRRTGPLVSIAYETIKKRILDNSFPVGEQMLEGELSEALGMSRTPVREALIRLEGEGLVQVTPRHGMKVLPVSPNDMEEIYQILTALESEAAELVALRQLDPAELAPLEASCTEMEAALAADDLQAWAQADEAFHSRLLTLCGNQRLLALCFNFWDQTHRVRMITLRLRPRPDSSTQDHRAVLNAIRNGDAAQARETHRAHRAKGGRMLVDLLTSLNLRGL
jgi:DNA-binding GntR family transcriptional regulator